MTHRIRWRRLAAYASLFLLPLVLLYVGEQSAVALRVRYLVDQELQHELASIRAEIPKTTQRIANLTNRDSEDPQIATSQAWLTQANNMMATPPTVNVCQVEAVVEAVFYPFRATSSGTMGTITGGTSAYVSPRNLHRTLFKMESSVMIRRYATGFRVEFVLVVLLVQLALVPGMPLAFSLMPATLRKAKVRWRHTVRIAAYSCFIPITVLLATCLLLNVGLAFGPVQYVTFLVAYWLFVAGVAIGMVAWWGFAINQYLKVPYGWPVALVLATTVIVTTLAAVFIVRPDWLIRA